MQVLEKLFDFDTIQTEEFDNLSFEDLLKSKQLMPGMILYFNNGEVIIVGNCTPFMQPTVSDGGIGWNVKKYAEWKLQKIVTIKMPHNYHVI